MAELATIARPYAEALFAASSGAVGATESWLDALAGVAAQESVLQFVADPRVDRAQVVDVLCTAAGVKLDAQGQNFVHVLLENKRLAALPQIAEQFRALKNAANKVSEVHISSAFPLEGAALADTLAVLEKRFACKLNATVTVDPDLIGGIRAAVGDEVFDASVKAQLEQMKATLVAA